uniref:GNAT family N-acetyltransferase n=1 Tax=Thaumasiovibrio occultus TaxID=1891184 RepID=UPI000B34D581|nr:GNAT family N-acetyltransferase [Thaumasiovibrio occultus]
MSSIQIKTCDYQEAAHALAQIPELMGESPESLAARIGDKPALLLVAYEGEEIAGVKLGYASDEHTFYIWLAGVAPTSRGKGVAQALLNAHQTWAKESGYAYVTVKSRNKFPAMLRLLIRNGYDIVECEKKDDQSNYRLHFIKQIQ